MGTFGFAGRQNTLTNFQHILRREGGIALFDILKIEPEEARRIVAQAGPVGPVTLAGFPTKLSPPIGPVGPSIACPC
jgi:hypothetical protein